MRQIREADVAANRNDLCPCGSGRKNEALPHAAVRATGRDGDRAA